jgi:hypothetical protein
MTARIERRREGNAMMESTYAFSGRVESGAEYAPLYERPLNAGYSLTSLM